MITFPFLQLFQFVQENDLSHDLIPQHSKQCLQRYQVSLFVFYAEFICTLIYLYEFIYTRFSTWS